MPSSLDNASAFANNIRTIREIIRIIREYSIIRMVISMVIREYLFILTSDYSRITENPLFAPGFTSLTD